MYVFIVAISLYTYYETDGSIPVGWMWFMAYSLVLVANVSTSSCTIVLYKKADK